MQGPLNVKLTQPYNHERKRHGKTMKELTRPVLMFPNIAPGAQLLIFEL